MWVERGLLTDAVWRLVMTPSGGGQVTLTSRGLDRLHGLLVEADCSDRCRVVIIEGAAGSFCQGMDLESLRDSDQAEAGARRYAQLLVTLREHRKLTIAAINGDVFGGGVGLVAVTDLALATRRSRFGLPEATLGLVPAMVLPTLLDRMAPQKARRLALTVASIDAQKALALGLLDELVADEPALTVAVRRFARTALRCDPAALADVKRFTAEANQDAINRGCEHTARALADPRTRARVESLAAGERAPWYQRMKAAR